MIKTTSKAGHKATNLSRRKFIVGSAAAGGGLALGIPAFLSATRYIKSELFGLAPGDPVAISGAILMLLTVAAAAGYMPARRASRVDPMIALRYE